MNDERETWQIMYDKYGEDLMPQHVIDDFADIRARVMKAVEANRGPITIEEALAQIKLFHPNEKENKKN